MTAPKPEKSERPLPWIVACVLVAALIVGAILVKKCPPVPAPAGQPAPTTGPAEVVVPPIQGEAKAPAAGVR